jgi:hypothetical protein
MTIDAMIGDAINGARLSALLRGVATPRRDEYTGLSFEPQCLSKVA